jgi:hypothetical protein
MLLVHPLSAPIAEDYKIFGLEEGPKIPSLEAIYAMWSDKRGDRIMPERRDISPRDMKPYLSLIQLYEVVEGGREFRIGVMGTGFAEMIGHDPTGSFVSQLPDPIIAERLAAALRRVVDSRAPVRTTSMLRTKARVTRKKAESILMPLGSGDIVTHVLRPVSLSEVEAPRG